jgi:hypothetical protein
MNEEGISLGWNCSAAQDGLRLGLRNTKANGYSTCPFDMMVSNYVGVCKCIEDDFKYFCDPEHLKLIDAPDMTSHFPNQKLGEKWIVNTYYNFVFNHESPYHGNLYLNEKWNGPNHFVDNNFENFIKRYEARISAFRDYLAGDNFINFVLWRYNSIPNELADIIKTKHPDLKFKINSIVNFGPHTLNALLHKNIDGGKAQEIAYMEYMNISKDEHPEEYNRFDREFLHNDNETSEDVLFNEHILLVEPKNNKNLNDPSYLR